MSGVGILDLEVPGELIEAADVPEDHVSIAAEVKGQEVIVAKPDEELSCELGHSQGYRWQATPQHLVQVLICVVFRVQEWIHLAILPEQGVLVQGHGADRLRGCRSGAGPGSLTSTKENSTAGTPAKAVKEYALLSMGSGRILGVGEAGYSALWVQASPASSQAFPPP